MSESKVQVAVRVRPLLGKEKLERCTTCVDVLSDRELLMGGDKQFTFDYVFDSDTEQQSIYDKCVAPLVENLFEGYNATVLAYGQTGSGKTFTMGSGCSTADVVNVENNRDRGVIPRATSHVFDMIAEKRAANPDTEFYLRVQFLELYGETLRDLLNPVATAQGKQVSIRDGPNDTLQIMGATEESVKSPQDMLGLLEKGTLCRTTGSTDMNTHSSRSHAIFTVILEQHIRSSKAGSEGSEEDAGDGETEFRIAKFHFVDLAGSERAKRTGATGQRMKEGININMGLLALGNVISALGSEDSKEVRHVPYRDSKLTRMLQDSLGGNSRTLMIACVSPADINFEETLNALRYANRARNIKNKAIINRDPASSQIAALKAQVAHLKQLIANGGGTIPNNLFSDSSSSNRQPKTPVSASGTDYRRRCRMLEEEVSQLAKALELEKQSRVEVEERFNVLQVERLAYLGPSDASSIEEEEEEEADSDEEEQEADEGSELNKSLHKSARTSDTKDSTNREADGQVDEEEDDESAQLLKKRFNKSQKALRKLVSTYDETLRSKEEAMRQIVEERKKFEALKAHFESKMAEMNEEVKETQAQKDMLESKLKELESNHHQTDVSRAEATRLRSLLMEKDKRLRELEERTRELQEARKSALEWQRKEAQVRSEIENVKREKVELQRRMNENHKRHAEMLKERQLEIAGLKRERARLEQDTNQLAARTERDTRLIQQKSEQVAAMQRKLREAQKLTMHPQALSERERKQRKELERLAALQVKREEELADLRRALAKKEEAIGRRNQLVEQLERLRNEKIASSAAAVTQEKININELVPEATQEDVKELELRLDAVDSEILFRDRQCREVLSKNDASVPEKDAKLVATDGEPVVLQFSTLEQAKDVCRVLMQMFVESKRELRERRVELDRIRDQVVYRDQAVMMERRRTETLLNGVTSPSSRKERYENGDEDSVQESQQLGSSEHDDANLKTPEKSSDGDRNNNSQLVASEVRIRNIEAKIRSLRVEESPSHNNSNGANKDGQQRDVGISNRKYATHVPVWDRLTSPSAATGIHKYGMQFLRRASLAVHSSMGGASSSAANGEEEECIDEIIKVPRRVSGGTRMSGRLAGAADKSTEEESDAPRFASRVESSTSPPAPHSPEKQPPKPTAGWERVANQLTESYQNKRMLDAEARKSSQPNASFLLRGRPNSPPRKAPPVPAGLAGAGAVPGKENSTRTSSSSSTQQHVSASELRKLRKDHFASERARRRGKHNSKSSQASDVAVDANQGEGNENDRTMDLTSLSLSE